MEGDIRVIPIVALLASALAPSAQAAASYRNDDGCSGYNESGEMMCKATTHDVGGTHVVIRKGFWDGSNGFGHDKALYYHNLWLQPSLDTTFRHYRRQYIQRVL
jgi:hypothetical protein